MPTKRNRPTAAERREQEARQAAIDADRLANGRARNLRALLTDEGFLPRTDGQNLRYDEFALAPAYGYNNDPLDHALTTQASLLADTLRQLTTARDELNATLRDLSARTTERDRARTAITRYLNYKDTDPDLAARQRRQADPVKAVLRELLENGLQDNP